VSKRIKHKARKFAVLDRGVVKIAEASLKYGTGKPVLENSEYIRDSAPEAYFVPPPIVINRAPSWRTQRGQDGELRYLHTIDGCSLRLPRQAPGIRHLLVNVGEARRPVAGWNEDVHAIVQVRNICL